MGRQESVESTQRKDSPPVRQSAQCDWREQHVRPAVHQVLHRHRAGLHSVVLRVHRRALQSHATLLPVRTSREPTSGRVLEGAVRAAVRARERHVRFVRAARAVPGVRVRRPERTPRHRVPAVPGVAHEFLRAVPHGHSAVRAVARAARAPALGAPPDLRPHQLLHGEAEWLADRGARVANVDAGPQRRLGRRRPALLARVRRLLHAAVRHVLRVRRAPRRHSALDERRAAARDQRLDAQVQRALAQDTSPILETPALADRAI